MTFWQNSCKLDFAVQGKVFIIKEMERKLKFIIGQILKKRKTIWKVEQYQTEMSTIESRVKETRQWKSFEGKPATFRNVEKKKKSEKIERKGEMILSISNSLNLFTMSILFKSYLVFSINVVQWNKKIAFFILRTLHLFNFFRNENSIFF